MLLLLIAIGKCGGTQEAHRPHGSDTICSLYVIYRLPKLNFLDAAPVKPSVSNVNASP